MLTVAVSFVRICERVESNNSEQDGLSCVSYSQYIYLYVCQCVIHLQAAPPLQPLHKYSSMALFARRLQRTSLRESSVLSVRHE